MLEVLVHASGSIPRNQAYIRIDIPADLAVERVTPSVVPGWEDADIIARRRFGDRWYDTRRASVLIVPSVVTRVEHNVLINQEHPAFGQISATKAVPAHWDARLLRKS